MSFLFFHDGNVIVSFRNQLGTLKGGRWRSFDLKIIFFKSYLRYGTLNIQNACVIVPSTHLAAASLHCILSMRIPFDFQIHTIKITVYKHPPTSHVSLNRNEIVSSSFKTTCKGTLHSNFCHSTHNLRSSSHSTPPLKREKQPPRPPKQKKRHAARLLSGRSRPRPPPSSSTLGPTTTENTTTTQRWFSNFVSNRTQGPFNSLYVVDNDSTTVESDEDGDEIMNQSISKNQSLPHIKEKKKEEVMPRMPPSRPTSTANNNTNSSSFGIYLDDYYTTANTTTTTTTTEKARKKQVEATTPPPLKKKQEEDEEEEKVPLKKNKKRSQNIASESSIDVYVAAPAVTKKRKNPTTLPPSSTSDSVLIEIPPSIDLTGATGVVGRITSGRTREILLDMMGMSFASIALFIHRTITTTYTHTNTQGCNAQCKQFPFQRQLPSPVSLVMVD